MTGGRGRHCGCVRVHISVTLTRTISGRAFGALTVHYDSMGVRGVVVMQGWPDSMSPGSISARRTAGNLATSHLRRRHMVPCHGDLGST